VNNGDNNEYYQDNAEDTEEDNQEKNGENKGKLYGEENEEDNKEKNEIGNDSENKDENEEMSKENNAGDNDDGKKEDHTSKDGKSMPKVIKHDGILYYDEYESSEEELDDEGYEEESDEDEYEEYEDPDLGEPVKPICKGKNMFCPRIFAPVCGNDGRIYDNACILERGACGVRAGLKVTSDQGKCAKNKLEYAQFRRSSKNALPESRSQHQLVEIPEKLKKEGYYLPSEMNDNKKEKWMSKFRNDKRMLLMLGLTDG